MFANISRPAQQKGITALGAVALIILLGFWVLVIIKLTPVYLEASSVRAIFEQYKEEAAKVGTDKKSVERFLSRFFDVNGIFDVPLDVLKVEKKKKEVIIDFNYAVEIPFFSTEKYGEIFVVLKFKNHLSVPHANGDAADSD